MWIGSRKFSSETATETDAEDREANRYDGLGLQKAINFFFLSLFFQKTFIVQKVMGPSFGPESLGFLLF